MLIVRMKHFIDLGTHYFEGLNEFIEKLNIDSEWSVYCYEPNLDVYTQAFDTEYNNYKNKFKYFEFNNKAISTYNGVISFNQHKGANLDGSYINDYDTGSNILDINPSYDPGNNVVFDIIKSECKCTDINNVIDNIIERDINAEIYIKCDIEGAEFSILPKLLTLQGCLNIKEIYIEWHERFWLTVSKDEYNIKLNEKQIILEGFKQKNIRTFDHH